MIDWINLVYGLSLKSTKGCQALPKYGSFCDTRSALAFLQKHAKRHKNFGHTHKYEQAPKVTQILKQNGKIVSDRTLMFKTHFI